MYNIYIYINQIINNNNKKCDYFKKDLARLIDEITDYYLQNR